MERISLLPWRATKEVIDRNQGAARAMRVRLDTVGDGNGSEPVPRAEFNESSLFLLSVESCATCTVGPIPLGGEVVLSAPKGAVEGLEPPDLLSSFPSRVSVPTLALIWAWSGMAPLSPPGTTTLLFPPPGKLAAYWFVFWSGPLPVLLGSDPGSNEDPEKLVATASPEGFWASERPFARWIPSGSLSC